MTYVNNVLLKSVKDNFMNILFTYPTLFNPIAGGVERVTDLLAREFGKRGHKVFYLNNKPNKVLEDYAFPGILSYFPYPDYKDERNVSFYVDYLQKNDIDVIINQCGAFQDSILYNQRGNTKAKVVSVIHARPSLNYDNLFSEISVLKKRGLKEIVKRIARIAIYPKIKKDYLVRLKKHYAWLTSGNNTDRLVLLSDTFKNDLLALVDEIDENKLCSLPNPVSFEIEKIHSKSQTLLYVGRLDTGQKRVDRLVRIWREVSHSMPDWNLKIIGDGPDRMKLINMAKNMERIYFLGFKDPALYYKEAAIMCMTSSHEGFPMVLMEAMSKGCVPIAFDSFSAIHDVIKDNRQLVRPFSLKEYVQKLTTIMEDTNLRTELAHSGFQNVRNFKIDTIVNRWEVLFDSLMRD